MPRGLQEFLSLHLSGITSPTKYLTSIWIYSSQKTYPLDPGGPNGCESLNPLPMGAGFDPGLEDHMLQGATKTRSLNSLAVCRELALGNKRSHPWRGQALQLEGAPLSQLKKPHVQRWRRSQKKDPIFQSHYHGMTFDKARRWEEHKSLWADSMQQIPKVLKYCHLSGSHWVLAVPPVIKTHFIFSAGQNVMNPISLLTLKSIFIFTTFCSWDKGMTLKAKIHGEEWFYSDLPIGRASNWSHFVNSELLFRKN